MKHENTFSVTVIKAVFTSGHFWSQFYQNIIKFQIIFKNSATKAVFLLAATWVVDDRFSTVNKINLSTPSELITLDQIMLLKFPLKTEPVHLRIGSKNVNFWTSRSPLHLASYYGQMDLRNNALTQPKWFYHIDHYLTWMASLMKIKCIKLFNNLYSLSSCLSISYLRVTRLCSNYLDSPRKLIKQQLPL